MKSKEELARKIKSLAEKRREGERDPVEEDLYHDESLSKNEMSEMSSMNDGDASMEDESRYRDDES